VNRHELLRDIHQLYQPRSYLEIGVSKGGSLTLSRTQTIAIDPAYALTAEIQCDLELVRTTSDEFFAREGALERLEAGCVDLAFIDGLHLVEFALRDFMNVERNAAWTSVIVFDDVLPRNVREPLRERGGMRYWAGDVYKLHEILAEYRPDLLLLRVDTEPTGVLIVLGADPENGVLEARYDEIVGRYARPDPQNVPESVLRREGALDPAALVESPLWTALREARDSGSGRDASGERVRQAAAQIPTVPARSIRPEQLRPREALKRQRAARSRGGLAGVRRRLRPVRRRLRKAANAARRGR
jgi:hypothetical protein